MKSLEEMIVDLPIYGHFVFDLLDKEGHLSASARQQIDVLFNTKKVNIKCVECKKEYPFDIKYEVIKQTYEQKVYGYSGPFGYSSVSIDSLPNIGAIIPPKNDEGIISYVFRCTMDSTHYQTLNLLYTIEEAKMVVRKIGQKPLNTDLMESHSKEYRKILDFYDSFDDYRHYEQCASRNLLAGACTYLRRVLEKMVLRKLKDPSVDSEQSKHAKKFEDKIKLVKHLFDEDLQDILNKSYTLLSKGVHELSDVEIGTFYSLILEVINIQLEAEKEKKERDERRSKLRSEINSINFEEGRK